jgi:2-epi-5-epi-valiolone synthase
VSLVRPAAPSDGNKLSESLDLASEFVTTSPNSSSDIMSSSVRNLLTGANLGVAGDGRGVELQLSSTRTISYRILHPLGHVFDPEDLSLARLVAGRPVIFAVDRHVYAGYGETIEPYAATHLLSLGVVLVDGDEKRKSWSQVEMLCTAAANASLPRDGVIVAVGGGVTLDLAGMAAAMFRRGVDFVRIPTTLIGIVDVAVGIKQGINFNGRKSLLGSFYPSIGAINDVTFLRTLPLEELTFGISEIIKMAMVSDRALFGLLESRGRELLLRESAIDWQFVRDITLWSERLMMLELQLDLYESSRARLVDFGHTFSPSLEASTAYDVPHGKAVALDMLLSTTLAVGRGLCTPDVLERLVGLYRSIGLPLFDAALRSELLMESLSAARQHRGGDLNLVLPTQVGEATFAQDVHLAEIESALAHMSRAVARHHAVGI